MGVEPRASRFVYRELHSVKPAAIHRSCLIRNRAECNLFSRQRIERVEIDFALFPKLPRQQRWDFERLSMFRVSVS